MRRAARDGRPLLDSLPSAHGRRNTIVRLAAVDLKGTGSGSRSVLGKDLSEKTTPPTFLPSKSYQPPYSAPQPGTSDFSDSTSASDCLLWAPGPDGGAWHGCRKTHRDGKRRRDLVSGIGTHCGHAPSAPRRVSGRRRRIAMIRTLTTMRCRWPPCCSSPTRRFTFV